MKKQNNDANKFFKPKVIQQMIIKKLREKLSQPRWEEIQELIDRIQSDKVSEQINLNCLQGDLKQILCYKDLCGNDITYHLVVNQHLDLCHQSIEKSMPYSKPEHIQIFQSAIKGLIKIKNQENYAQLKAFLQQLLKILKIENEMKPYKTIQFSFDIVFESHFGYQNNLRELKLLLSIHKLLSLGEGTPQNLLQFKQNLEFSQHIISKNEKRTKLQHLNQQVGLKNKLLLYKHYSIYRQICDDQKWDKIINISNEYMFGLTQDGLSSYMKMLQKAPFEFLTEYHNKFFDTIQSQIHIQQKKHGYNMLHCIAENENQITQEFIDILKRLNLDDYKNQAYFDQIPLVFYIDKQKIIQDQFLTFLSNQNENQSYADQEGLQIIGQIYAKSVYNDQKIIKPKYKPLYKQVPGNRKNKNKRVKPLYKRQINKDSIVDEKIQNQFLEIYQQIVQLHKLSYLKGIQQEFDISQFSFSDFHLQYQIFNIEKPIIVFNSSVQILKQFLYYIENDFGKNLSQDHINTIQQLLNKLNIQITIQQLILQRKIIILNAVLNKFESQCDVQQAIKDSISNILSDHKETFEFAFISYSKYEQFQDYLLLNNLISIEKYQYSDALLTLKKLLKLGYKNKENLGLIASKISQPEDQISIQQLFSFEVPKQTIKLKNIYKEKYPTYDYYYSGQSQSTKKQQEPLTFDNADQEKFIQFYFENLSRWTVKLIYQNQSNASLKQQYESVLKQLIQLLVDLKNLTRTNWAYRIFKRLVYIYIVVFENFQIMKRYFNPERYSRGQNKYLSEYFLRRQDFRTVELLLLNFSSHKYFLRNPLEGNTISSISNYHIGFSKGWWLGLNLQQFKDLIENNDINEEERNQVLANLSANGQCAKLKLVLGWINNLEQLDGQFAWPALCNYQDFNYIHGLQKAVKDGYTKYKYNFYISLSPLGECDIKECQQSKIVNNKCHFSSNYFQSDFEGTARLLNDTYIEKLPENKVFEPGYNSISQILFPNKRYLCPDPDGRLLRRIFETVLKKQQQQNWDKYLELIEQNIEFYNDREFRFYDKKKLNLSFIFEKIEITSKRGQFFKKMIDMLIKGKQLENTLNQEVTGPEEDEESEMPARSKLYQINQQEEKKKKPVNPNYLFRRSQYLFNQTRQDKIKKNRFSDILKSHFNGISFEDINLTQRHKQIYYGLAFEDQPYNEQDLFIALMGRSQSSILQILVKTQNLTQILTELQIIQYLIMHGPEQTVIEILNLVDQINLEWFYYKGIPLLAYIVFKKWYKLYFKAEQYLFDQWILKPDILKQVDNNSTIELTIHQFATLNQFYVQNKIPLEKQFLARTSQFLIPKQFNPQIKSYQIYSQLVELFPQLSRRDLEIFCLQTQFLEIDKDINYIQIFDYFTKQNKMKINMFSLLTLFTQKPDKQALSLNSLINEFGQSFDRNISHMTANQIKQLFDQIYNLYGVHHPAIEEIINLYPNECIVESILDSSRLAVLVAQSGECEKLKSFLIGKVNPVKINLHNISLHLMKIIMTLKYGLEYLELFDIRVHLKYYVDALSLITESQQGSITQKFLSQVIDLLSVNHPQLIDVFYKQVLGENNQIKRAFQLIIKIKEFNYQVEQIKQLAIAKTDYLIRNFEFEISDSFGMKKSNNKNIILMPSLYTEQQLMEFFNSLPIYYQSNYERAIDRITGRSEGYRRIEDLIIKFEESNLSELYNDIVFLNYELRSILKPQDIFVYTKAVQYNQTWFNQLMNGPITIELLNKYCGQEIFFNSKTILSKKIMKFEIQEKINQLKKNIIQGIKTFVFIEDESFLKLLLKNEKLINVYRDLRRYCQAVANYPTLVQILNHSLGLIEQVMCLFPKTFKCFIRFEQIEQPGTSPRTCFLDDYFSFGKGYLMREDKELIYVIQISCQPSQTANNFYLDTIFNWKTIDSNIKDEFKLGEDIDGLIYRFQIKELISQSCNKIRQKTNINFKLEIDIKNQIQSLDYQDQVQYLRELQIYFSTTINTDLNNILQSQKIEQDQQNQLLQLHKVSKPLKFGYIWNKFHDKLRNRFGILQTHNEYESNSQKNDILHVCYLEGNEAVVKFCKFVKLVNEVFYYIDLGVVKKPKRHVNPRQNRKKGFKEEQEEFQEILLRNIRFVICYTRIKNEGMITFVDNGGYLYLIGENDTENVFSQRKLLTNFTYKVVFSKECNENELRFENFRLKDPQESLSKIDIEEKVASHNEASPFPHYVVDAKIKKSPDRYTSAEKSLLKAFAYFSGKLTKINELFKLPKENESVERKEFIPYCMLHQTLQYSHSRAGQNRQDRIKFYDLAKELITVPINQNYLNFHITHEAYTDIVYVPVVGSDKVGEYTLSWSPKTKGVYFLYMNGHQTPIKFQVIASTTLGSKYELINSNQDDFSYFLEKELRVHLFDEFQNFITKVDDVPLQIKVKSNIPDTTFNNRYESKQDCFSLYLQPCNHVKKDNHIDECELEITICEKLVIKSLAIQIQAKKPLKERLLQFKTKFHYVPCFYKIMSIDRDDILKSSTCLNDVTDQHLMKFIFTSENVDEGEGPEREYFTQLGIELKNKEKKYFSLVYNSNNYFIGTGFYQKSGLHCAYAFGLLLAYAIANQLEMGISFALPFWKVIIDLPIEFTDLEYIIDQQSYKSYLNLQTLNEQQLEQLELTFVNQSDGEELCENGSDKKVNKNNLKEYLELTAKYLIYQQHKNIFDKIIMGFKGQYDPKIIINNVTLDEINQLIDHSDYHIDNQWLLDKIEYKNKINYENFVKYILEADSEKLKLLIKFTTGSMYPQEDENGKVMKVSFSEKNKEVLPTAKTCYREMSVPIYLDYETLKKKLDQGLEWGWNYFGTY